VSKLDFRYKYPAAALLGDRVDRFCVYSGLESFEKAAPAFFDEIE
jgi:hypothetical protein